MGEDVDDKGYKKNDRVGSWTLNRSLGQGGHGQVWKVHKAGARPLDDPDLRDARIAREDRMQRGSP